jgi:hypothetical protein
VETSCLFYIAGDKLGFSTFGSLLLYFPFVSRLDLTDGSAPWSSPLVVEDARKHELKIRNNLRAVPKDQVSELQPQGEVYQQIVNLPLPP